MAELIPCPFCGGTNLTVCTVAECEMQDESHECFPLNSTLHIVVCDYTLGGCGASIGAQESEEEAIETWNRRAYK